MLTERPENHCADDSGCRCTRFELRECTQRALAPIMLKKKPRQPPTPSGEQLLAATASLTAPTRNTNWQSQPPSRDAGPWAALRSDRRSARRKPIERSSGADSMASQGSAKEKRRKLKLSASKTTVLDLIGITEKQDDAADGTELLDDMRSNKFPRHRAHWLVMDPLQRWRLRLRQLLARLRDVKFTSSQKNSVTINTVPRCSAVQSRSISDVAARMQCSDVKCFEHGLTVGSCAPLDSSARLPRRGVERAAPRRVAPRRPQRPYGFEPAPPAARCAPSAERPVYGSLRANCCAREKARSDVYFLDIRGTVAEPSTERTLNTQL